MAVGRQPELPTFERASNLINELAKGRSIRAGIEVEDNGWWLLMY